VQGQEGHKRLICRGIHPETLPIDGVGIFEWVNKFSYLGDMIGVGGGCEEASRARLGGARCKFRELAPILTKRGAPLIVKGRLYRTCVRSVLVHSSETWTMRVEDMNRLERSEKIMVPSARLREPYVREHIDLWLGQCVESC